MDITLLQYYRDKGVYGLTVFQIILIVLVVFSIISFIKSGSLKRIVSHWHHRFEIAPFTSQEFYVIIEELLKGKEIKGITTFRSTYPQAGLLSPMREYLSIGYREYQYNICAAPYGKGFFVSWWLGEMSTPIRDFFINLPFVGKFFTKRPKTFFELDTEVMFKEAISGVVKDAINKLTETKGMRSLSDTDWNESAAAYLN